MAFSTARYGQGRYRQARYGRVGVYNNNISFSFTVNSDSRGELETSGESSFSFSASSDAYLKGVISGSANLTFLSTSGSIGRMITSGSTGATFTLSSGAKLTRGPYRFGNNSQTHLYYSASGSLGPPYQSFSISSSDKPYKEDN